MNKIIEMTPAQTIAEYMTRLYDNRMTTTSGGNLSVMDENGSLWISPSGIDKAHLTPDDIMEVKADGTVAGKHRPSTEYPFHLAVRKVRPDLKAVLHAHPAALVALSLARKIPDIDLFPGTDTVCGFDLKNGKGIAIAKYALPGSELLGSYIADKFAKGYNVVILENHGVCLGAETMAEAYRMLEALEYSARIQISAATLGSPARHLTADELCAKADADKNVKYSTYTAKKYDAPTADEKTARAETVEMAKRCYKNKLFSAADGVFATRLSDGGFVITPADSDVMLINEKDTVRVSGGFAEDGKTPSPFAAVIGRIFDMRPDIKSVAVSRPVDVMGFAVTDAKFDSHLIPEGYICLRNVNRYKFGAVEKEADRIAAEMSMKTPIAIVENDCVIVAGTSPLNAYDRLEVMEFGARSLRYLAAVGAPVVRISEKDIRDIEVAFGL